MITERPTVGLVADRAGVSVASVSRVLNGLPASPDMARRVQDAAAELGYVPNAMARSLKVRRTEQLALAFADIGNPVYVEMMRAVEAVAREQGYRLLLSSTGSDPAEVVDLLRSLDHGYADGLIISPLRVTRDLVQELQQMRVPTVVIGKLPTNVPIDNVRADSPGGVRLALQHLADQGHQRIAFLNGPADTVPGAVRAKAFEQMAKRLHLDPSAALRVNATDFTLADGREAVERLLDHEQPDAILGANDLLAIAALHALAERGLAVPRDVAVVGMDDTELAAVCTPGLSSVSLGSAERGRLAAQMLLDRLREPDLASRSITVAPRLTVRASSASRRRR